GLAGLRESGSQVRQPALRPTVWQSTASSRVTPVYWCRVNISEQFDFVVAGLGAAGEALGLLWSTGFAGGMAATAAMRLLFFGRSIIVQNRAGAATLGEHRVAAVAEQVEVERLVCLLSLDGQRQRCRIAKYAVAVFGLGEQREGTGRKVNRESKRPHA